MTPFSFHISILDLSNRFVKSEGDAQETIFLILLSSLVFNIVIPPPLLCPNRHILFKSISSDIKSLFSTQLIIRFKSSNSLEKLLFPNDFKSWNSLGSFKVVPL